MEPTGRFTTNKPSNSKDIANENEILGNLLTNLPLIKIRYEGNYYEEVPRIFFVLVTYFKFHDQHLKREGLFRVNGEKAKIKELDTHLAMGDYSVLKRYADYPNEVANYLKEILRELAEPLCPPDKYEQFRDIPKGLSVEQKLDKIVDLLYGMPELNRSTILFLARFMNYVVSFSADNKMNSYNISVIVTPNIFRVK